MSKTLDHARYMHRAIELARQVPRLPFGAVLVHRAAAAIVAEGWNRSAENPTWHGEVDAINRCAAQPPVDWGGLVLYTTAEPCPMCQSAVLWAGISEVVFGTSIRSLQQRGWWQIDIESVEVVRRAPFRACTLRGGILESECDALFDAAGAYRG